jgi:hypothetical protein
MEQTPTFDSAAQRLQRVLAEQGWPTRIVWRHERDVVHLPGGEIVARHRSEPTASLEVHAHYEDGFHHGVGIAMYVPCKLDGAACAMVYSAREPSRFYGRNLRLQVTMPPIHA